MNLIRTPFLRIYAPSDCVPTKPIIEECGGDLKLAKTTGIFHYIDKTVQEADSVNAPTPRTPIVVYVVARFANWKGMFESFGVDLAKLMLTEHQIAKFCQKYPDLLGRHSSFFLLQADERMMVCHVTDENRSKPKLGITLRRYDHGHVWGLHEHVITPAIAG